MQLSHRLQHFATRGREHVDVMNQAHLRRLQLAAIGIKSPGLSISSPDLAKGRPWSSPRKWTPPPRPQGPSPPLIAPGNACRSELWPLSLNGSCKASVESKRCLHMLASIHSPSSPCFGSSNVVQQQRLLLVLGPCHVWNLQKVPEFNPSL